MESLRPRRAFRAVLPLLMILACSDGGDPIDPDPDPEGIGPGGGVVGTLDGNASLVIPPGALDQETMITVEAATNPPAHAGLVDNTAYEFGPDGLTFDVPALLTLHYDDADVPGAESALAIHRAEGNGWTPLPSVVDAGANTVRTALDGFSTYAIVWVEPDDEQPPVGIDAAVVDLSTHAWEFTEVAPAVTYACDHAAEETAVVELRTNRTLALDSLEIPCALRFVVAGGHTPRVGGGGGGVTHIRADSDLDVSSLPIDGDAGLVILISGRLRMVGVQVDGPIDVHFVESLGPVGGMGSSARRAAGGGAEITDVSSGIRFGLHFDYGVDTSHDFKVTRLNAPSARFDGDGYLGAAAFMSVSETIAQELKFDLELRTAARVEATANLNLSLIDGLFDVQGDHQIRFEGNAAAVAKLEFHGIKASVALAANTFGDGTVKTAVQDLSIEASAQTFENLGLELFQDVVKPSLRYDQNGGGITGNLTLTAVDVTSPDAYFGLDLEGVVVGGNVAGTLKARAGFKFSELIAIDVTLQLDGDSSIVEGTGLKASGVVDVKFGFVTARGEFRQAAFDVGRMQVRGPAQTELHVLLDVGELTVFAYDALSGGGAPLRVAGTSAPQAAGDSIIIRGVTFGTPDTALASIIISGADEPVLIERVNAGGAPVGILIEQSEDVTIRGSRIAVGENAGIVMNGVTGTTLIEEDTLEGPAGVGMILNGVADPTVRDVQVELGGPALGLLTSATPQLLVDGGRFVAGVTGIQVGDFSDLTIDGTHLEASGSVMMLGGELDLSGATILGGVFIGPAARATVTGNTFSGPDARLDDVNMSGGLYVDPVGANSGLDPDTNVSTLVDFDGNGCADYPTARNEKTEDGCAVPGVAPPTP